MGYLLDTDIFIRAKREHYRFKVCPGFWDWIVKANQAGVVFSIAKVQAELTVGTDDVATWAAAQSAGFFLPPTAPVTAALVTVSTWATQQKYQPQAIAEFFSKADYWLVAYALATGHQVVTHEVPAPDSKKKIKIPDACMGVGVAYSSPFQMLDDEGARFVL
jgi:hypothetical protein